MGIDIDVRSELAPCAAEPAGVPMRWSPDLGTLEHTGVPSALLWLETMGDFLEGLYRAAGPKRFGYILQSQGRKSIRPDWQYISSFPSFAEGMRGINRILAAGGWGRLELPSYEPERKEAVIRIYNCWESLCQRTLKVNWGTHFVSGKFAGVFSRHFEVNCWATQRAFLAGGDEYDEFVIAPSSVDVEEQLARLLREEAERQEALEVLVEQRTSALRSVVAELEEAHENLREKAAEIQELSTPVVQLWNGILMAPLVGYIDDTRAQLLVERLLGAITERSAEIVLLDITGVARMDADVANHLIRIVHAARLLGARALLVGISPAIAGTLVGLGVDLSEIETSADLQRGLSRAFHYIGLHVGR